MADYERRLRTCKGDACWIDDEEAADQIAAATRLPTFNPKKAAYVHTPYIAQRTDADVQGAASPYTIDCLDGQMVMKINQLGGGTIQFIALSPLPATTNLCGYGFGRGGWNSAHHAKNHEGYNPQIAGFNYDSGPEVPVVVGDDGKTWTVKKFPVPLLEGGRLMFVRNTDLAPHEQEGVPDPGSPGKWLETNRDYETIANPLGIRPDGVDEDAQVPPWTQIDEVMAEVNTGVHYENISTVAGCAAVSVSWYYSFERPPKAMDQFDYLPGKDAAQMSSQARPGPGGYNDLCGILVGNGFRLLSAFPPFVWSHFGLDEVDAAGNVIMQEIPDFGDETGEDREVVAWLSLNDLLDPAHDSLKMSQDGKDYLPAMNTDPNDPNVDHLPNGTGGADSIAFACVGCSADPNDDKAVALYTPRSPITRLPIEGWNAVTGKLMYRDNRRLYSSHRCLVDGGGVGKYGMHIHYQTYWSGLYCKADTGPYKDIVEVLWQHRDLHARLAERHARRRPPAG